MCLVDKIGDLWKAKMTWVTDVNEYDYTLDDFTDIWLKQTSECLGFFY